MLGEALVASPLLAEAVDSGQVGIDEALVLAPIAAHESFERDGWALLALARTVSPGRLRVHRDRWVADHDPEVVQDRSRRHRALRSASFSTDLDGMTVLVARLTPEDGRVVRLTVDHLVDQQRLDGSGRSAGQRRADALVSLAQAFNSGAVSGGRSVPQLMVAIDAADLATGDGLGFEAFGAALTAQQVDRLLCDCELAPYVRGRAGEPLWLGRAERTATNGQYRGLLLRDRGCVFPGCDRPPGWCQAHHIRWWEHGGRTDIDNLVLVCHEHHHAIHDDGWVLAGAPGRWDVRPPGKVAA
jgi:hypothetical protein